MRVILRPDFACRYDSFVSQGAGHQHGFHELPEGRYSLTVREVVWGTQGDPLLVTTVDVRRDRTVDLNLQPGAGAF